MSGAISPFIGPGTAMQANKVVFTADADTGFTSRTAIAMLKTYSAAALHGEIQCKSSMNIAMSSCATDSRKHDSHTATYLDLMDAYKKDAITAIVIMPEVSPLHQQHVSKHKSFISSACHSVSSTIRQKQHLSTSYLENDSSAKSHSFFGHWSACPPLLQQRHESKHQSAGFMPIQRRSTQCMGPNRHQKLDLIHYIVNQNDERALKLDPTWIFHIKYLLQHDTIQHDTFSQLWSASCRLGGLSKNKRPKIICISSAISSTTLYNHDWKWILPTWPTYCKQPFVQ